MRTLRHEAAIELAQDALIWLASEPEAFERFLALTGIDAAALRLRAADPVFLAAVLDHVLERDAAVLAFAAAMQLPPETVAAARAALPGGDDPSWT